jgi:hypothetical protein
VRPIVAWDAKGGGWEFRENRTAISDNIPALKIQITGWYFFPWVLTNEQIMLVHKMILTGVMVQGRYETWGQFVRAHWKHIPWMYRLGWIKRWVMKMVKRFTTKGTKEHDRGRGLITF